MPSSASLGEPHVLELEEAQLPAPVRLSPWTLDESASSGLAKNGRIKPPLVVLDGLDVEPQLLALRSSSVEFASAIIASQLSVYGMPGGRRLRRVVRALAGNRTASRTGRW